MSRMVVIKTSGDFKHTDRLLEAITHSHYRNILEKYAKKGVEALAAATPVDSGLTASSWGYEIEYSPHGNCSITWTNSNVQDGWANVAILLQYGHGTRNGGYVRGRNYINPAIQPIFDEIAENVWKEVTKK